MTASSPPLQGELGAQQRRHIVTRRSPPDHQAHRREMARMMGAASPPSPIMQEPGAAARGSAMAGMAAAMSAPSPGGDYVGWQNSLTWRPSVDATGGSAVAAALLELAAYGRSVDLRKFNGGHGQASAQARRSMAEGRYPARARRQARKPTDIGAHSAAAAIHDTNSRRVAAAAGPKRKERQEATARRVKACLDTSAVAAAGEQAIAHAAEEAAWRKYKAHHARSSDAFGIDGAAEEDPQPAARQAPVPPRLPPPPRAVVQTDQRNRGPPELFCGVRNRSTTFIIHVLTHGRTTRSRVVRVPALLLLHLHLIHPFIIKPDPLADRIDHTHRQREPADANPCFCIQIIVFSIRNHRVSIENHHFYDAATSNPSDISLKITLCCVCHTKCPLFLAVSQTKQAAVGT